ALICQSFQTPRHPSQAQTAVRCSYLVRQSKVHGLKNLRSVSPASRRPPVLPLRRKCNRERRETPQCPNSTEGNEGNKDGSALRSLSSLPSVQNVRTQSALHAAERRCSGTPRRGHPA